MKRETDASPFAASIMKPSVLTAIAGLATSTALAQYSID
jgi:hypothetical protein